jgi:hypothetical protein
MVSQKMRKMLMVIIQSKSSVGKPQHTTGVWIHPGKQASPAR